MGSISLSIPVSGQPNATEDVKVANNFTTLQTWANGNVDTNNISPTAGIKVSQMAGGGLLAYISSGVSFTAAYNTSIQASPGITVTLPSPVATQIVAVHANNGVTTSSPVTVAGSNINGLGLLNASSFLLGTPSSSVILQGDGTNWLIIAGQQDTGWVTIGLQTNWATTSGYYAPGGRLIGDRVWLRGSAQNNTGGPAYFSVTLPTGMTPARSLSFPAIYSAGVTNYIAIAGSNLACVLQTNTSATTNLDGLSYSLGI